MKSSRKVRRAQRSQSFMDGVRQFLTPQVWKQVRQAGLPGRRLPRWDLQPLVLMLLLMTFSAGDSQAEQFETARGFSVSCYVGRKRPGKTLGGLQKALARVSTRQLRVLAQGVRDQIVARYGGLFTKDEFTTEARRHGVGPLPSKEPSFRRPASSGDRGVRRQRATDCLSVCPLLIEPTHGRVPASIDPSVPLW